MAHPSMRRWVRLLMIALLAGGVGTAASTLAVASDDSDVPGRFAVPAAQAGDRWSYGVTALDGSAVLPPDRPFESYALVRIDFERGAPEAILDGAGEPRIATPLRVLSVYQLDDDEATRVQVFHVLGGETVSATAVTQGGGQSSTTLILPNNQTIGDKEGELQLVNVTRYDRQAPCGHWSALQDGASPREDLAVAGACLGSGPFHAVALLDGLLVVERDAPEGLVQLGFSTDLPVPVQVVQPAAWNSSQVVVWDLQGFKHEGLAATDPSLPGPADPVSFAPRRPWGPDDPSLDHPFPLSEAYDVAMAQGPLAAFMSAHPAAYLQSGKFHEQVDDLPGVTDPTVREHAYVWTLQATDGASAVKVEVARTYKSAPDDGLAATLSQLPVPPKDTVEPIEADPGPFPAPSVLPGELPAVDSVLQRWLAYAVQDGAPNAWGFSLDCAGEDCSGAKGVVMAGRDFRYRENSAVCVSCVIIFRRTADLLEAGDEGETVLHLVADFELYKHVNVGPLVLRSDGHPPSYVTAASTTGGLPAWGVGIAAGGAVLALAALAWAAKAAVGLWHRPAGEHPVRTQLVQLLEAEPGLHHQELMRRLARGNSVVAHHLRALEREGLVVSRAGPRYRCYFPAGKLAGAAAAPLVKTELAAGILGELAAGPATGQELAQRLGVAPSSIAFHVRRFEDAGLVQATRQGRTVRLSATESGLRAAQAA